MNRTVGKRVGQFISTQLLRDDYFIIADTDASSKDINNQHKPDCSPFQLKLHYLESLCVEKKLLTHDEFILKCKQLNWQFNQTQLTPSAVQILELLLPETVVSLNKQDFAQRQDYARLLNKISTATGARYMLSGIDTGEDGQPHQWVIAYKGRYKTHSFRFTQQGQCLNDAFFSWLVGTVEYKAHYRISCHDCDGQTKLLCLPDTIHSLLIDKDAALLAA